MLAEIDWLGIQKTTYDKMSNNVSASNSLLTLTLAILAEKFWDIFATENS